MLAIPSALQSEFEERLRNESIPNNLKGQYLKMASIVKKFVLPVEAYSSIRSVTDMIIQTMVLLTIYGE